MPKRRPTPLSQANLSPRGFVQAVRVEQPTENDRYPFDVPTIRQLERLEFNPGVTFFVGENGSGKSTLLEAIAIKLGMNGEGGGRNHRFSTTETNSELTACLTIEKGRHFSDCYFLRAESFYNVATYNNEIGLMDGLHHRSHGEAFLSLFMNRLVGHGLYLFDEPEAALSPQRQLAMIPLLHRLIHHDSQMIIATHSPILLAFPNATIYEFSERGIHPIAYEETEHFTITRDFLNRHGRMIEMLIEDEEQNLREMGRDA